MVLRVRATIGEWTASYATTHYTIEASYLESLEPDLASAVVRVANREHDEHSTMTAIAGRLFRDGEVKKASPIVGGPVPPIRKEEFEALVYKCLMKGSSRVEIERGEGYASFSFDYKLDFEEGDLGDVNREVSFHVFMS